MLFDLSSQRPASRIKFIFDDGGRAAAGFRGRAGDCVTRAIAIATGKPYREVYDALNALAAKERTGKRKKKKSNSREGDESIPSVALRRGPADVRRSHRPSHRFQWSGEISATGSINWS